MIALYYQAVTVERQGTMFNKVYVTMVSRCMMRHHSMNVLIHNVRNCDECRVERQEKLAFVEYYDILPNTEVLANNGDRKINSIRLK